MPSGWWRTSWRSSPADGCRDSPDGGQSRRISQAPGVVVKTEGEGRYPRSGVHRVLTLMRSQTGTSVRQPGRRDHARRRFGWIRSMTCSQGGPGGHPHYYHHRSVPGLDSLLPAQKKLRRWPSWASAGRRLTLGSPSTRRRPWALHPASVAQHHREPGLRAAWPRRTCRD